MPKKEIQLILKYQETHRDGMTFSGHPAAHPQHPEVYRGKGQCDWQ